MAYIQTNASRLNRIEAQSRRCGTSPSTAARSLPDATLATNARAILTWGPLTPPDASSVVRCHPSLQVDGSCSSADVAMERHESERLAVNLAVSQ